MLVTQTWSAKIGYTPAPTQQVAQTGLGCDGPIEPDNQLALDLGDSVADSSRQPE
jgi:hypothetical protein